jgi:hypothetical protein
LDLSIVVADLERKFNLVFLQFKKPSTYYQSVLSSVPVNHSIMIYPILSCKIRHLFRKSKNPTPPREDSINRWHDRAGHLGQKALEKLVYSARGVRIKGLQRIDYEDCTRVHAKQIIKRSSGDRPSPRPFHKIAWDLFDFPNSYNGISWLLLIKEIYSRKIFGFPLHQKSYLEVFSIITIFEAWV